MPPQSFIVHESQAVFVANLSERQSLMELVARVRTGLRDWRKEPRGLTLQS